MAIVSQFAWNGLIKFIHLQIASYDIIYAAELNSLCIEFPARSIDSIIGAFVSLFFAPICEL